uniref:RNA polymerase II subunit B1 CTD phosphatase RPAP2 homolog n=1 Tax=Tetraselmis sp. GSL018 TaxID=582737 RepID=A0A061SGF4_9CHLO
MSNYIPLLNYEVVDDVLSAKNSLSDEKPPGNGTGRNSFSDSSAEVSSSTHCVEPLKKDSFGSTTGAEPGQRHKGPPANKNEALPPDQKAVLEAVLLLMDGERLAEEEVRRALRILSPAEIEGLAEERALAGKCGNPNCGNRHVHVPARERQRIHLSRRVIRTEVDRASNFCSPECEVRQAALLMESFSLPQYGTEAGAAVGDNAFPGAAGKPVADNQIIAPAVVEKDPDKVAADTASGLVSCLAGEAEASAANRPCGSLPSRGSVEGFQPKSWRGPADERRSGRSRRVSFSDDSKGGPSGGETPAAGSPCGAGDRPARVPGNAVSFASCERVHKGESAGGVREGVGEGDAAQATDPTPRRRVFRPRPSPRAAAAKPPRPPARSSAGGSEAPCRKADAEPPDGAELSDGDLDFGEGWLGPVGEPPELSAFGRMHTTLFAWVTALTQRFLLGGDLPAASELPRGNAAARQSLRAQLARCVRPVLEGVGAPGVTVGAAEAEVDDIVSTLHVEGPLPSFRARDWRLLAAVMLCAASHHRLASLQRAFGGSRDGLARFARGLGWGLDEFDLLHELLYPYR